MGVFLLTPRITLDAELKQKIRAKRFFIP